MAGNTGVEVVQSVRGPQRTAGGSGGQQPVTSKQEFAKAARGEVLKSLCAQGTLTGSVSRSSQERME